MDTLHLQQQLAELANVGLTVESEAALQEVLKGCYVNDRGRILFHRLLQAMSEESEEGSRIGQPRCHRAWSFDIECIGDAETYLPIVHRLASMADATHRLRGIEAAAHGRGFALRYVLDHEPRRLTIKRNNDWADVLALCQFMVDLPTSATHFYGHIDGGQGLSLFVLSHTGAARINQLMEGHFNLTPVAAWLKEAKTTKPRPRRKELPVVSAEKQRAASAVVLADEIGNYVSSSSNQQLKPYAMAKKFAVNDQLSHPVFGVGIVVRVEYQQAAVLFSNGVRMLAHNRAPTS